MCQIARSCSVPYSSAVSTVTTYVPYSNGGTSSSGVSTQEEDGARVNVVLVVGVMVPVGVANVKVRTPLSTGREALGLATATDMGTVLSTAVGGGGDAEKANGDAGMVNPVVEPPRGVPSRELASIHTCPVPAAADGGTAIWWTTSARSLPNVTVSVSAWKKVRAASMARMRSVTVTFPLLCQKWPTCARNSVVPPRCTTLGSRDGQIETAGRSVCTPNEA